MVAKLVLIPRELFSLALGLFVSGCVPGGGASNFWTLLMDGNVHLSITMTFISMIASICRFKGIITSYKIPFQS